MGDQRVNTQSYGDLRARVRVGKRRIRVKGRARDRCKGKEKGKWKVRPK